MATRQTSFRSFQAFTAAGLIAIGFFLLFANVDAATEPVVRALGLSPGSHMALQAFGLAALHAVQACTFNNDWFSSSIRQILLSFWPVSAVIVGMVMLRNVRACRVVECGAGPESASEGTRS